MKRTLCIFCVLVGIAVAEVVTVSNFGASAILVDGQSVAASSTDSISTSGTVVVVELPGGARVIEVREGTVIVVDDSTVTAVTPLSAHYGTFLKGFWTGLGFELFGLLLVLVRKMRGGGTGME